MLLHEQKVLRVGLLVVYYEGVSCGHIEERYALGWRRFGIYTFRRCANKDTTQVQPVFPLLCYLGTSLSATLACSRTTAFDSQISVTIAGGTRLGSRMPMKVLLKTPSTRFFSVDKLS